MRLFAALLMAVTAVACSDSNEPTLVPVSVIAESESSLLIVSAAIDECADPITEVVVDEQGGDRVAVSVRFVAGDTCTYGGFFTDIDVQLDGPLGDRTLLLTQPEGYAGIVGSDVCIIDGEQRSSRCTVQIGTN